MRKGDDKGDTRKNGKKKIEMMLFIVATNVIASLPPECRQTGMLTAHAKIIEFFFFCTEERSQKDHVLTTSKPSKPLLT